jgi:hypothetical protein
VLNLSLYIELSARETEENTEKRGIVESGHMPPWKRLKRDDDMKRSSKRENKESMHQNMHEKC